MQHNATWRTSSEYCWLTVPSGRVLNYVSFAWKIQILEIFGFPLVVSRHLTLVAHICEEGICNSYTAVSSFYNHSFNVYPNLNDSDSGLLK
jgi:hypothetical protein